MDPCDNSGGPILIGGPGRGRGGPFLTSNLVSRGSNFDNNLGPFSM